MSYCLNPNCEKPQNPSDTKFCLACQSALVLSNRYRPLKLIGKGGFGRTFLAVDEFKPSKTRCVIKQFFPQNREESNFEMAARLFEQEAVRLDELGIHPQIPTLLAYFEQDNRQYLVQEYIDGQNLAQELKERGAFQEEEVRQILVDMLPVLQFMSDRQIIHRDIKPENIIRRQIDNLLFLVDFGAAKFATDADLSITGTVIGSAGFAAPEQALGKATFSSDIYSLGVTCIHLLTNIAPFDLYSANEANWVWRDFLTAPVSLQLSKILDRMLEGAVSKRYPSAAEVLKDLQPSPTIAAKVQPSPPPHSLLTQSEPDLVNWQCTRTLAAHSGMIAGIRAIAISPDGKILASGSEDESIKLWNLPNLTEICTLTGHSNYIRSLAFTVDGKKLVSASDDKTVRVWDIDTKCQIITFKGHLKAVNSVAIGLDGETIATGSDDKTIKIWKLGAEREVLTINVDAGCVQALAFSPQGEFLASSNYDNKIKVWNTSNWELILELNTNSPVESLTFSSDGAIIGGTFDNHLQFWRIATGINIRTIKSHSSWINGINAIATSPDGKILASTSSGQKTIKLWNLNTGEQIVTLEGHTKGVTAVAFTPDGATLVSGSYDKTIKVWHGRSGTSATSNE